MEEMVKIGVNEIFSGYLDVKVAAKARRGFTPWKAWHKRWCEIKRVVDGIENGAELILKTSPEGAIISRVLLPRSATVCRINSRSKQFAFGVFILGRNQKPLLFLSDSCESKTQKWISFIRLSLSIASYIPVGICTFYISIVDNDHSRTAGLSGLFGILSVNAQEIMINDSFTGDLKIKWKWHQFHQFHLQAVTNLNDDKKVCVLHTSRDFVAGPGQLHFYCDRGDDLLNLLVSRGKISHFSLTANKRFSQSEGDLFKFIDDDVEGYNSRRKRSDSTDSGVRVSLSSDDSGCAKNKSASSMIGLISKTPGGSEDEDDESIQNFDLLNCSEFKIPRVTSGLSLASGVYEEIPDTSPGFGCELTKKEVNNVYSNARMVHLYEDPQDLLLHLRLNGKCTPPPLPPRTFSIEKNCDTFANDSINKNTYKFRSRTLPTRDLRRLSQNFGNDGTDYMVMSPKNKVTKNNIGVENMYVPMSPIATLKTKLENCYMVMSGKRG